jgi:hypothetical protein
MKKAQIGENNIVVNIANFSNDETNDVGWVSYSEDNPAYIGGDYVDGYFYPPQPFASWTRDKVKWIPPKPMPTTLGNWYWNEEEQEWQD